MTSDDVLLGLSGFCAQEIQRTRPMPGKAKIPLVLSPKAYRRAQRRAAKRAKRSAASKAARSRPVAPTHTRAKAMPNATVRCYYEALRDPFAPTAIGCRTPDAHAFPTVCYHYKTTFIATSSSAGEVKCTIFPSPCLTAISAYASGTLDNPTGVQLSGGTAFAQNKTVFHLLDPTEMASKLSEYRTVAWGIRLLAKDTATNTKGKIYIATVPTTANAPSWNTLNTVTAASNDVVSEYCCGYNVTYSGNIPNLPSSKVYSMQDLLNGEIQVSGLPLTPAWHDFRGTTDRSNITWNTGQVLADEGVFNNTTGLVNATAGGRKDVASLRGGMAVAIWASGLPASTNEFDIEIIYHVEGSPNISGLAGAVAGLVPSSQAVVIGSSSVVEDVIAKVRLAGPMIKHLSGKESNSGGMMSYVTPALALAKGLSKMAIY